MLHYTGMEREPALQRLCDPAAEVSAHYLIGRDGGTWQLVEEDLRAWHAGAGTWRGRGDVNSRSIGIELVNSGAEPFPWPQMAALERLLSGVMARHGIAPQGVIGHSDMAPARKQDPGARFDWRALARRGLAVWPRGGGTPGPAPDMAAFRAALTAFGYGAELDDALALAAFRLRFFPGAGGPLAARELAAACDLAARFGVDAAGAGT